MADTLKQVITDGVGALKGKEGYAVKATATNKTVELATLNADCIGIIINDGPVNVGVALPGEVTHAVFGAGVDFGQELKSDADGKLIPADGAGDDNVIALALEDGAADNGLYKVKLVKYVK